MGTGGSKCPADEMMDRNRRQVISRKRDTQSKPSDFYCACRDGNIGYVKEHLPQMSIEDVDKLEANVDTALHVATRNDHREVVKLLIDAGCSKTTLNWDGKMSYEEITTPEMRKIYERLNQEYFLDSDPKTSHHTLQHVTNNEQQQSKHDWVKTFNDYDELDEYSLNRQTVAMWFKFFNWVSHRYDRHLSRADFRANLFDLESDRDFDDFLKRAMSDDLARKRIKEALIVADRAKDIVPLITLYTAEDFGGCKKPFYKVLNEQLALASENDSNTAHFCDRFIYEFYIKSDQLEERAYTGLTFRGAIITDSELKIYEELTINGTGVIATKTFLSTSRNKEVAIGFTQTDDKSKEKKPVLYVYNIPNPCNGIFSVKDASKYPHEEEILIIPGNIFKVCHVYKNSAVAEIHMDHMNKTISILKKLAHTIKAMRQRPNPWQELDTN